MKPELAAYRKWRKFMNSLTTIEFFALINSGNQDQQQIADEYGIKLERLIELIHISNSRFMKRVYND